MEHVEGFDAGDTEVPEPLVGVAEETRERLRYAVAAVVKWITPEALWESLESGERIAEVDEHLARPGEADEVDAYVDVLLNVLQSPAGAGT